mmetsp:Transcript_18450/g.23856  ORF Transcript_18450/g.23856 Transcript_18450/m.23856 type:complete len:223 (+) Transcript_18450:135-803(+)
MVKQTKRGCFQELLGCEAKNEFKISSIEESNNDIMYSLEESTCFCRFCCKNQREFKQNITVGADAGGPLLMSMHHPFSCPVAPCTCCWRPEIIYADSKGASLGKTTVPFFWCLPNFSVQDGNENLEYNVHQPECCFGLCVNCFAEGCCNCNVPFYVYSPENDKDHIGKIFKHRRGFGTQIFSDADTFQVDFPDGSSPEQKARLLGTIIFINMAFFESQNDSG